MATTTTNPTSSATAAAPSPPGEGAPPPPPLFSLGLIADIQYADMADSHVEGRTQRFRECPGKLEAALSAIRSEGAERNPSRLAAVLTLGDMINGNREDASRNPSDLETVASLIDAAFPPGGDVPVFHILGNHCLDLPKRRVTERLAFPPSALLLSSARFRCLALLLLWAGFGFLALLPPRAAAARVTGLVAPPADDEGGLCGTVATAALTPGLGPLLAPPPRGSGRCTVVGVWADLELVGEDESSGATVWCFVLFLRW